MTDRQKSSRNRSNGQKNSSGQPKRNDGSRGRKKNSRGKAKKQDPVLFWGDPTKLPAGDPTITSSPDTLAIVRSLGPAPIPGTPAEPYFALVYERAAGLATVLGHAAMNDSA